MLIPLPEATVGKGYTKYHVQRRRKSSTAKVIPAADFSATQAPENMPDPSLPPAHTQQFLESLGRWCGVSEITIHSLELLNCAGKRRRITKQERTPGLERQMFLHRASNFGFPSTFVLRHLEFDSASVIGLAPIRPGLPAARCEQLFAEGVGQNRCEVFQCVHAS